MKCKCGKKATINPSYVDRSYCDRCFLRYIEKRVRKDIRINKPIEPRDTVSLLNDNSKEFFVAKYFLERVFGDNLEVKEVKRITKKTVVPTNLDRDVSERLQEFLENKDKEYNVKILDNVLEEEIVELCRILGKKAKQEEEVNPLIEEMEENYPGTKFSLHKSFQQLS